MSLLREFNVQFLDGNLPPHKVYDVPGGGQWFKYIDPEEKEGEHYSMYKQALAHIQKAGL